MAPVKVSTGKQMKANGQRTLIRVRHLQVCYMPSDAIPV